MNTNPQAVRVANEKFRRIADKAAGLYGILKIAQAEDPQFHASQPSHILLWRSAY